MQKSAVSYKTVKMNTKLKAFMGESEEEQKEEDSPTS